MGKDSIMNIVLIHVFFMQIHTEIFSDSRSLSVDNFLIFTIILESPLIRNLYTEYLYTHSYFPISLYHFHQPHMYQYPVLPNNECPYIPLCKLTRSNACMVMILLHIVVVLIFHIVAL